MNIVIIPPPPINCDPFWYNVLALLPLKNGFQEIKNNLVTFDIQPVIHGTSSTSDLNWQSLSLIGILLIL